MTTSKYSPTQVCFSIKIGTFLVPDDTITSDGTLSLLKIRIELFIQLIIVTVQQYYVIEDISG